MSMTITLGWWIIPALVSLAAVWWFSVQDYSGDYNFNVLFTAPVTGFLICLAWLIYTAIGWAVA